MDDNFETAVLAGGCAWIIQQLLRHPEGVISTRTGFMGGENDNPTEENNPGHAEVVEATFDPERLGTKHYWTCSSRFTELTSTSASLARSIAPRSSTPVRRSGE